MDGAAKELDHAGLVRPFLASRVRPRYDAIAPGSARRDKLLNKLCHRYEDVLDWRRARSAGASERELRGLGALSRCYCLCALEELDGREVPLAEALAALSGSGGPILLICRPAVLAYFEPEYEAGTGKRFILQRPEAEPIAAPDPVAHGSSGGT